MSVKKKSATVKDFIKNKSVEQAVEKEELTLEQKEAALKAEKQRKRSLEQLEFEKEYEALCAKYRMRKSKQVTFSQEQNPVWVETTIVFE